LFQLKFKRLTLKELKVLTRDLSFHFTAPISSAYAENFLTCQVLFRGRTQGRQNEARNFDSEYQRNEESNFFMIFEPLQGKQHVKVTDRRTKTNWAERMSSLSPRCAQGDDRYGQSQYSLANIAIRPFCPRNSEENRWQTSSIFPTGVG
jgi:hypothetical protein